MILSPPVEDLNTASLYLCMRDKCQDNKTRHLSSDLQGKILEMYSETCSGTQTLLDCRIEHANPGCDLEFIVRGRLGNKYKHMLAARRLAVIIRSGPTAANTLYVPDPE